MNQDAAGRQKALGAHGHLDAESLVCFAEDLLEPAETARCQRHLAGCARCQAEMRRLTELAGAVTTLLSGDEPGPMPAAVAGRLDRALAELADPAGTAGAGAGGSPSGPGAADTGGDAAAAPPVTDLNMARVRAQARRRRQIAVGAVAASVLAVVGAAAGLATLRGTPGAPRALPPSPARSGPLSGSPRPAHSPGGSDFASRQPYVTHSGASYQPAGFDTAVDGLLAGGLGGAGASPRADQGLGSPPANTGAGALPQCVLTAPRRGDVPVVADVGSFRGEPAAVLVYQDPGGARGVRAYVVAVDCSGVLYEQHVAR